ncbi:MAG TPA: glutamine-hydrolyzing carbamoyl-phosphate synthase small subunit [Buchnera sp. (in: enterobacteria)]|nr:glutamine-hydrolyzing carbamoyl-phosphate synthase small subunit [Buchnera sp. (in: enterobacteria)]
MEKTLNKSGMLVLEDGSVFYGISIGAIGKSVGEVVFNTSMTGYQEILTDPSYAEQIITFTYPHIGNVGINNDDYESEKIHVKGIILRNYSFYSSHYKTQKNIDQYLKKNNIIAIADIDTRRLTHILRNSGSKNGCIFATNKNDINNNYNICLKKAKKFSTIKKIDITKKVTTKKIYHWNINSAKKQEKKKSKKKFNVIVYDYGIKNNILKMLHFNNCNLTIVPANTNSSCVLKLKPDGIFFSNGPGDPRLCKSSIITIQSLLKTNIPMFGICFGHQLIALSIGAKIKKMKFGHHGSNHPVQNMKTKKIIITSQNHGFTVDHKNIPKKLIITHRSLFDNSIQGLSISNKPVLSFQGHPESNPGPHDASSLFSSFTKLMEKHKKIKNEKK